MGALPSEVRGQNAYRQHNLVSDLPGKADRTDPHLVNPWGIATSATSPFWLSDNHSGLSTLYNSTGGVLSVVVTIPPPAAGQPPAAPTGIVFNGNAKSFLIGTNQQPARFIFSSEDGTISAWNSGTNALLEVDRSASNSIYKGLAIAAAGGSNYLYASDFHNGRVDVFDSAFQPVVWAGSFVDPNLPSGYAPFNVQSLGGILYVTYALPDENKEDDVAGPGHGYIDQFDTSGQFIKRFASGEPLNSPWGLALAPSGFGQFSGALLIGNFGDGLINAFDPETGTALGHLQDENGQALVIEGLWGLKFGNGGQGGDPFKLYFSAGISGGGDIEDHGLFGSIEVASTITVAAGQATGTTLNLQWTGGAPLYLVQRKTSFADTNWSDVLTTTNQAALVPRDAAAAFYRVTDHVSKVVTPSNDHTTQNSGGEIRGQILPQ